MSVEALSSEVQRYQSLIFDLDNTLYPQRDFDSGAFTEIERRMTGTFNKGAGLAAVLLEAKRTLGPRYPHLFDDVIVRFNLPSASLSTMMHIYRQHKGCNIAIQSSIREFLRNQQQAGKALFVVSNGHTDIQEAKLERLGLKKFLNDYVICNPSAPERLKPNPWAYQKLRARHSLCRAVMIGDTPEIDGAFADNCHIPFIHFQFEGSTE